MIRLGEQELWIQLRTLGRTLTQSHPPVARGTLMLWVLFAILVILWLLGWGFHLAGSLIHLLLVIAVILLVVNLVTGRPSV